MVLFAQPCLGKGVRLIQAGRRLHGRRKHSELEDKVQAEQKGEDKDAYLDFMCLQGACLACRLGP